MKWMIVLLFIFGGCAPKVPQRVDSYHIVFKTPKVAFNDKAFISIYDDHVLLQLYKAGNVFLELEIYDHKVCKNGLCEDSQKFYERTIGKGYEDGFLKDLTLQAIKKDISYKNKQGSMIKITKESK